MIKNLGKETQQSEGAGSNATTTPSTGPEAERAYEQLRSSVRLINCVNTIPDISTHRRWQEFLTKMMQKPSIVTMLNSGDI